MDGRQGVKIVFYDSFAETYQGHGTDKALIGGLLGLATDDTRIKQSLEMAKEYGMEYYFEFQDHCDYYDHPNTTIVTVKRHENRVKVGGVSLGGGLSKIFMIDDEETDIRLSTDEDFAAPNSISKQANPCGGHIMEFGPWKSLLKSVRENKKPLVKSC